MSQTARPGGHRIGFVSTRFGQIDGVSLETAKWAEVLERLGHHCFYFAGACDRPAEISYIVPEAHFSHPEILSINDRAFSGNVRPPSMTAAVHRLAAHLKDHLYEFVRRYELEVILVENALSIPMNIPLGVAITQFIAETGMPAIGHHHDFMWERSRYMVNCVWDFLDMAFPPSLPSLRHVTINSQASRELSQRIGVSSRRIPNVMDFDNPPAPPDSYTDMLRADLGIAEDEYFILQPTRVIRRKGIEHAIELVRRLDLKTRLVISHASGDEGDDYAERIFSFAELLGVNVVFADKHVGLHRATAPDGHRIYALSDVYPHADLVTYPSILEGFGNAFLEAVYYSRPILVNNYTIYALDIKPKGFQAIDFDGFITSEAISGVRRALLDKDYVRQVTEHNYALAKRYFSYTALEEQLSALVYATIGGES
jgi:glycosyltransferase involved in cell wall biosynthesis